MLDYLRSLVCFTIGERHSLLGYSSVGKKRKWRHQRESTCGPTHDIIFVQISPNLHFTDMLYNCERDGEKLKDEQSQSTRNFI